jgi:hypothetical protein
LCCGNIEPKFVKNIKSEMAKISSQSYGSQHFSNVRQKTTKISESQKSIVSSQQTSTPLWRRLPKMPEYKLDKAKSLTNNLIKVNDKQIATINDNQIIKANSFNNVNKDKIKEKSQSNNGRLSSSTSDVCDNERRNSEKHLVRSKSQPSVISREHNNNCDNQQSVTTRERMPSLRKITVNKTTYQILNCIGQGGSSKVSV